MSQSTLDTQLVRKSSRVVMSPGIPDPQPEPASFQYSRQAYPLIPDFFVPNTFLISKKADFYSVPE